MQFSYSNAAVDKIRLADIVWSLCGSRASCLDGRNYDGTMSTVHLMRSIRWFTATLAVSYADDAASYVAAPALWISAWMIGDIGWILLPENVIVLGGGFDAALKDKTCRGNFIK